ncbi:hypothetical protein F4561_004398 [Lipingzhangella halophila]|uniref:DUF3515 domain-containing protein n=1 Tax=Lipingzhangella halophila TaxID=1783352 RepID=A0A7W7RL66_9ACTN|nr:DUF3515 domain-containing protein [Lipingzhangella halophila]MBB4933578.1 hypothetical protein [Lipingzhangella halophila]
MRHAAIAGLLAGVAAVAGCTTTTAEVPEPAPDGQAAELCRTLVENASDTMFDESRIAVEPESDFVAAWGDPVIALRCGVDRPDALRPDSELMVVNDIAWFAEPVGDTPNLFTAVGREAYVELTIPPAYGAPAEGLVEISDQITEDIPESSDGEL